MSKFAVRSSVDGALLGGCEIQLLEYRKANLSYFTLPQHRGRGVASRAVAFASLVAFESLEVMCIEIIADPDNIPSRHVATRNEFQEIGMRNGRLL